MVVPTVANPEDCKLYGEKPALTYGVPTNPPTVVEFSDGIRTSPTTTDGG